MRSLSGLGLALLVLVCPALAFAQDPPHDDAIEINYFDPAIGPHSFLTVSGAETDPNGKFALALLVNFMTRPFTVFNVANDQEEITTTRTEVVKSYLSGTLHGSYGYKDRYQVNAFLPIVFSMEGEGLDPATAMPPSDRLQVSGLGDMKLEAVVKVWQQEQMIFSAIPAITVPTSTGTGENAWLGDDLPSFRPRGAIEWSDPDNVVTAGANAGLILRKPRTVYSSEVGQQLTYGAAVAFHANQRIDLLAEIFGRKGFSSDLDESPLEVDGGLRLQATNMIGVLIGGGTGLVQGIGSPGLRVFASVTWSPDYRDSDGDGIANMQDRCPTTAEDKDGFRDDDGCAEEDNDEDFVPDATDKCPVVPEDRDTFDDDDGCPEDDNDKDGFADDKDRCPNHAEDKLPPKIDDGCPAKMRDSDDDGIKDDQDKCIDDQEDMDSFQDDDGCPEIDNDGDNVPDELDQCPQSAEDIDSYMDEDGCNDADNDADGFLDTEDKCPGDKETVNSHQDEDGCADSGGEVLARIDDDKVVFSKPLTWKGSKPKGATTKALDQAFLLMRAEAGVLKWRIVVAAEKQKKEQDQRALSQSRADAIAAYLKGKSRVPFTLEAVGAVSDTATTIIVATERGTAPEPPAAAPAPARGGPAPAPAANAAPDRDADGVNDDVDNCPDEAGKGKYQGCKKRELVELVSGRIELKKAVAFEKAAAVIKKRSFAVLDNLARVLAAHPEIPRVEIGARGADQALAQSRAESVVAYLVGKGVAAERLAAVGAADPSEKDTRLELTIVAAPPKPKK